VVTDINIYFCSSSPGILLPYQEDGRWYTLSFNDACRVLVHQGVPQEEAG
jgi:hypothetical protein